MGLIAHPIKNIPSPYLEASHFCVEKSNTDLLSTPLHPKAERHRVHQRREILLLTDEVSAAALTLWFPTVSQQTKPSATFPCHSGRQAVTYHTRNCEVITSPPDSLPGISQPCLPSCSPCLRQWCSACLQRRCS